MEVSSLFSGEMSSLSEIAKCLESIQRDMKVLSEFKASTESNISDLKARVSSNAGYMHDLSGEVRENKDSIAVVGLQSDSVLKQLQDSNSLTSMDLQINSLTQQANTKDLILSCSNLAVFGLTGDIGSIKDQFDFLFGPLLAPGGLLSQSFANSIETVELGRPSASPAMAVVVSAKNPESAIRISAKMQALLRKAIDDHGGRTATTNPFRSANVSSFFERSLIPLRNALNRKATLVKECFPWMKSVRIQLERRQLRLALTVIPNADIKELLKRENLLPFAELPTGMSLEAMANHRNFRWKRMRDIQPPEGAAPVLPPPVAASDAVNDEINLTAPDNNMETDNGSAPPSLPLLTPRPPTMPAAEILPPPPPASKDFKQPRLPRGRSRSKSKATKTKDKWALEPSPKRARSNSISKSSSRKKQNPDIPSETTPSTPTGTAVPANPTSTAAGGTRTMKPTGPSAPSTSAAASASLPFKSPAVYNKGKM